MFDTLLMAAPFVEKIADAFNDHEHHSKSLHSSENVANKSRNKKNNKSKSSEDLKVAITSENGRTRNTKILSVDDYLNYEQYLCKDENMEVYVSLLFYCMGSVVCLKLK